MQKLTALKADLANKEAVTDVLFKDGNTGYTLDRMLAEADRLREEIKAIESKPEVLSQLLEETRKRKAILREELDKAEKYELELVAKQAVARTQAPVKPAVCVAPPAPVKPAVVPPSAQLLKMSAPKPVVPSAPAPSKPAVIDASSMAREAILNGCPMHNARRDCECMPMWLHILEANNK